MTYYINPMWIYLMSLSEGLKILFFVLAMVIGVITFVYGVGISIDEDDINAFFKERISKIALICTIIFSIFACVIPSREVCKEMIIASVVTHENVDGAIENTKELIDYTIEKIDEMND